MNLCYKEEAYYPCHEWGKRSFHLDASGFIFGLFWECWCCKINYFIPFNCMFYVVFVIFCTFPLIWHFTLILSPIYQSETDFEYLSMSKSKEQSRMDNPEKLTKLNTQDEEKQIKIHKTICVGHHYTQANTHNVNKTWDFLQTTGCKDEPNIVFWGNLNVHHNTETTTMRCR